MKVGNKVNPVILILLRRIKHFAIIGIIAVVLSSVFSSPYFIHPKYKASVVFYPVNILPYGSETPVEQALQILDGSDIRDEVINTFNLAFHYDIDTTSMGYYSKVISSYNSNITFKSTRYESVEVQVSDTDPATSKAITDHLIVLYNKKAQKLQRKKSNEVVLVYANHLKQNQKELDSIDQVIQDFRLKYGILDYNIQVQEATRGYFSGGVKNNAVEKEAKGLLISLQEKGGEFFEMTAKADVLRGINSDLTEKYSVFLMDVTKELTYSDVVSNSRLPDKKSYPIRWLIVLSTTLATLLMAVIVFAVIDGEEKVNNSKEKLVRLVTDPEIKMDL